MRSKLTRGLILGAVAMAAATYVANVLATPATGFAGITLAKGTFEDDIAIFNQALRDADGSRSDAELWFSQLRTKGPSDLYVQNNEWQIGGSTGWHTHPGPSLIIVTGGTVTAYDADCTQHVYNKGDVFVDPGGDHVHLLRNESGNDVARTVAVQLIPAGATRRIDAEQPVGCALQ